MAPFTNAERLHSIEIRFENLSCISLRRRRPICALSRPHFQNHSLSSPPLELSTCNRNLKTHGTKDSINRSSASTVSTKNPSLLEKSVESGSIQDGRDVDMALAQILNQIKLGQRPSSSKCDKLIFGTSDLPFDTIRNILHPSFFISTHDILHSINHVNVNAALNSKHRHREVKKLYTIVNELDYTFKYNTYQAILRSCLATDDVDAALKVFRDLQDCGMAPNKVTYCCLISALGKQRKKRGSRYVHLAYDLWQELVDASSLSPSSTSNQSKGGTPENRLEIEMGNLDPVALRTGMKACVDVGKINEAEQLLRHSIRVHDTIDVKAYNIIIKGHAQNQNISALEAVMHDMRQSGIRPSSVTFNTLIDAHVRSGRLDKARECMEQATAEGIALDAWTFTSLIKGCVLNDDVDGGAKLLEDMQYAGIKPTYITYSTLIDGYARRGQLVDARLLLDEMIAAGAMPTAVTYNSLLRGCVEVDGQGKRDLSQGLQLLDDMQVRGVAPAVDTFNTLMSAAVNSEEPHLALDLYQRLLEAGLRPDGVTYTVLMQAFARLGRVSDAVGAFESLSRDPNAAMDVAAYNAMVDAFARSGEMPAAEKMVESACKFAKKCNKPPPVEAFGALVTGYARLQQVDAAVQAVRRFHAAGGTPDEQMLDQLVELCVKAGEFKVAMQGVRALELMGSSVDKDKYKAMVMKRMDRLQRDMVDESVDSSDDSVIRLQSTKKRKKAEDASKNVYLERFKFWTGLPNSYYD